MERPTYVTPKGTLTKQEDIQDIQCKQEDIQEERLVFRTKTADTFNPTKETHLQKIEKEKASDLKILGEGEYRRKAYVCGLEWSVDCVKVARRWS